MGNGLIAWILAWKMAYILQLNHNKDLTITRSAHRTHTRAHVIGTATLRLHHSLAPELAYVVYTYAQHYYTDTSTFI